MEKSDFSFSPSDGQVYNYDSFGEIVSQFDDAISNYGYSLEELVPEESDRDLFIQALRDYEECGGSLPSSVYSFIHSDSEDNENTGDNENENDTEGDSLSGDENTEENNTEDPTSVEQTDYTEALNSIYSKLDVIAENTRMENQTVSDTYDTVTEYIEYQKQSILDKPINDYTVGESLGLVLVSVILIKLLIEMLERIWMKWKS